MNYPYGKIELHCHLDGSVRPETVFELLKKEGNLSDEETVDDIRQKMVCRWDCESLDEYLERFALPGTVLQTKENLTRVTKELMEDLQKDGVVYAEIRFAPQFHLQKGLSQEDAVIAVLEGIREAEKELKTIRANVIACMMRMPPEIDNKDANDETYRLACKYKDSGVILDLAGWEAAQSMQAYENYYLDALQKDIPRTIHAGEACGHENVAIALEWKAPRIGHGCRAIESVEVMKQLKKDGAILEICPVSNVQTKAQPSFKEHSIRKLFDYGISVCVSTDNRTVSNTTLENEYQILKDNLNFTTEELREMNRNALKGAFLSLKEKEKITKLL